MKTIQVDVATPGGGLLTGMIAGRVVAVRLDQSPSQEVE